MFPFRTQSSARCKDRFPFAKGSCLAATLGFHEIHPMSKIFGSHKAALALAAILLTASVSPSALAQSSPGASPATVQPGAYKVEPGHTRVLFAVSHMGFTPWYGDFTGASGALQLDVAQPANSHIEISVPTASVATTNTKLD